MPSPTPTCRAALAAFALLAASPAHDVVDPLGVPVNPIPVGAPALAGTAWGEFFEAAAGPITVTSVLQTPAGALPGTGLACPTPLEIQFSRAEGFAGANGFVLSNGLVENFDDDGPAVSDPAGCAGDDGNIGPVAAAGFCNGLDPALATAMAGAYGLPAPLPTANAAILRVDFTAAAAANVDVSYTFASFEFSNDPSFFDAFGIFLDGSLVAGGVSRVSGGVPSGPAPGTDPFTLAPSAGPPASEFNSSNPLPGFFQLPASTTGLRTVPLALSAGPHSLEFHVADAVAVGLGQPCGGGLPDGADNLVPSALFVGLATYASSGPAPSGLCGAVAISRVGHPAETVPPHGPTGNGYQDLQIRQTGGTPGSFAVVALGLAGGSLPIAPPCALLVDLGGGYFEFFPAGVVPAGGGPLVWPPAPPAIPPGSAGATIHFQFWNVAPTFALENSKGLRVRIGPS